MRVWLAPPVWLMQRLHEVPRRGDWLECLLLAVGLTLAAGVLMGRSLAPGTPPALYDLARLAVVALFFPALLEESLFRGVLLPRVTTRWSIVSTCAFIGWHPLQSSLWLPAAHHTFTDPRFLIMTALLSLACIRLVARSRSLWPAVLLHWGLVVLWKAAGGARFIA